MRVIRAETAGFCMGVGLALRKLDKVVAEGSSPIYTLGPIIHNPQVLQGYAAKGVQTVLDPTDVPQGAHVVIRAHGIPRNVEEDLKARKVTIVDATCPKVKKAQLLIAEQSEKGGRLLLYGEDDHPEVKGLRSYARETALLFDSLAELKAVKLDLGKPHFLAAQTTQDKEAFVEIIDYLQGLFGPGLPVLNTICDATRQRQAEAVALASEVDAFVVAGGYQSGNTRRLVNVIRDQGVHCLHVETPEEIPDDEMRGFKTVGLTAGASTPAEIILAIQKHLELL